MQIFQIARLILITCIFFGICSAPALAGNSHDIDLDLGDQVTGMTQTGNGYNKKTGSTELIFKDSGSSGGKTIAVDDLKVTTINEIRSDIIAGRGAQVSIGDVELSDLQANSITIDTRNTVVKTIDASDGQDFELGTVKLKGFHGNSATIKHDNFLGGDVKVLSGSSVSIGKTSVGDDLTHEHSQTSGNKTNFLPVPEMPEFYPGIKDPGFAGVKWAELGYGFNRILTPNDKEKLREELYNDALTYHTLADIASQQANIAQQNGDIKLAEYYEEQYQRNIRIYNSFNQAQQAVLANSLDSAYAKAEAAYEIIKATTKVTAAAVGGPYASKVIDSLYLGLDFAINSSDQGVDFASRELISDLAMIAITNIKFNGQDSIASYLDKNTGDLVGKSGMYEDISKYINSKETKEQLMRAAHHLIDSQTSDFTESQIETLANNIMRNLETQLIKQSQAA